MTSPVYYNGQPLLPINGPNGQANGKWNQVDKSSSKFDQFLQQELTQVKFSQHALQRMQNRNIKLDSNQLVKLNEAVEKAEQKGAKESLILMNNMAFVVSIKNNTVITALDKASLKDNVFTNIDSAVVI